MWSPTCSLRAHQVALGDDAGQHAVIVLDHQCADPLFVQQLGRLHKRGVNADRHDIAAFIVENMSDLHDGAPPLFLRSLRLSPTLPVPRSPSDLRTEAQNRPGSSRSSMMMLPPADRAGKALCLPQRSRFRPQQAQNPPKSAIYPAISRLEPSCDLGQKGALPVPGNMVVAVDPKGQPAKAFRR